MPFGIDFPQINGYFPSWAESQFSLDGFDTDAIQSVDWDEAVEIGDVYGAGPTKQGTTRGQSKPGTVKVKILSDAADDFEENLALGASDGESVSLTQFGFQVQWLKADNTYAQVLFEGCRVQKIGENMKIGVEAFARDFEFNVTKISRISHGIQRSLLASAG